MERYRNNPNCLHGLMHRPKTSTCNLAPGTPALSPAHKQLAEHETQAMVAPLPVIDSQGCHGKSKDAAHGYPWEMPGKQFGLHDPASA